MIASYDPLHDILDHPDPPVINDPVEYASVELTEFMSFSDIIESVDPGLVSTYTKPRSMEELEINEGNGQSYGYIVYRNYIYNLYTLKGIVPLFTNLKG